MSSASLVESHDHHASPHALHWRTGIDLGAAREKVRVARALPALPRISEATQRGQISYATVRALTAPCTFLSNSQPEGGLRLNRPTAQSVARILGNAAVISQW